MTYTGTSLNNLLDIVTNGLLVQTSRDVFTVRSIATSGTSSLSVSNASGVAGNPTINLSLVSADITGALGFTPASLASPTFTGTPIVPTAAVDTNTTQAASTAFVLGQASSSTPLINGTAAVGTATRWARGDHVHPTDTSRASTTSPSFTGTVSATTGFAAGNSGTQGTLTINGPYNTGKWIGLQAQGTDRWQIADDGAAANNATANWATSTAYALNAIVNNTNNGSAYTCTTAGTSASSGTGPSGNGTGITDGTAVWSYAGVANQGDNFAIWRWDDPRTSRSTPFSINRQTQQVQIAFGQNFGSQTGSTATDLSKHIQLYSSTYGFSVTSSRLNMVAPSTATIFANVGGSDVGGFSSTGLNATVIGATTPAVATFTSVDIGTGGASLSNDLLQVTGTVAGYLQQSIQNLSTGTTASSDFVATANDGTDLNNYVDLGINSSGYSDPTFTITGAHDGYLYAQGGDLAVGTGGSNDLVLFTGGTLAANERMRISSAGAITLSNGASITGYALLASPTFTGTPAAPTATVDTNTTQLATTAFVLGQAYTSNPAMNGTAAAGSSTRWTRGDHVHPTDTSRAPIASPTFTTTATVSGATLGTAGPIALVTNATTSAGSNVLNFADTTGVAVGQTAIGANISDSTTVTAVTATTVTLTTNVTGTGVALGATIRFVALTLQATWSTPNANFSMLRVYEWRSAAGTSWTSATRRIGLRTDVTDQGFMEFNPVGYAGGVAIGSGTPSVGNYGLYMASSGALTIPSAMTLNSGALFGSQTGGTNVDLSKHISLYSTTYGFGITSSRLNIVVPSGAGIYANIAGTDAGSFTSTGLNATTIGATTAAAGTFTNLTATGTVSGTGFTNLLSTYAPLASPTFSGTPIVPTAAADTNTTQAASTAFVLGQASALTPLMDGTAAIGTGTRWARSDHVHPTDTTRAPLASPTFTGTPSGPTASFGDSSTQLATTSFVNTAISGVGTVSTTGGSTTLTAAQYGGMMIVVSGTLASAATLVVPNNGFWSVRNTTTGAFTVTVKTSAGTGIIVDQGSTLEILADGTNVIVASSAGTSMPLMNGVAAVGTASTWSRADHVHPTDTSRAPLASPTFTGTVTIPSGASISGFAPLASPTFTGTPAAPTAAQNTNTTQVATTAYVLAQASSTSPVMDGTATVGTGTTFARADHIHPTDTSRAPLASPVFTGTVTLPADPSLALQAATKQYVDALTGATSSVATTGGSTTLSAAQYNCMILIATGTLTSNATFVVPNSGEWIVSNNTTGAFSLTIKTSAGTSVTVDQGQTVDLIANGTNVVYSTSAGTVTPLMDGVASAGSGSSVALANHVHPTDTSRAPLASPTFTGTPAAPTAAQNTNTTQVATTAFVLAQASSTTPLIDGTATVGIGTTFARADHIHPTDTSRAPLASPTFTGTVTLPADPVAALQAATKQYVDALTSATVTVPTTGGSTTLSAAQYNCMILIASGTLASNATFVVPNSGEWIVVNNTTGAFTLTIKTSAGTGVTVDQGQSVDVIGNGTNVIYSTSVGTVTPLMDGVASAGSGSSVALANHVHPTDTSRSPLASPTFTGTPAAPTATQNTNTTQLATTAFVLGQSSSTTPNMDGAAAVGTGTTFARADHTHPTDTSRAPLASPTFTGTPAAPTAAQNTNTTQVATTAFVLAQASSTTPLIDGTATIGTGTTFARADHIHPTDTSRAPVASPTFTGTVTLPADPASALQAATKQYVDAATSSAVTVSTTGGSTTLTAAQYNAAIILATGTLASNATFVVPNSGEWVIANNTTGAFTLTVKTSAGTGVTVDQGQTTDLVANGTNVVYSTSAGTVTPLMDGTASAGSGSSVALANHVHPTDTSRAPLASPTFTGVPASPTAAQNTNTTQLATTAFVLGQASSTTPTMDGTATIGTGTTFARADHIHPTDTSRAPTASPTFTGTVTIPGKAGNSQQWVNVNTGQDGASLTNANFELGSWNGIGFSQTTSFNPAVSGSFVTDKTYGHFFNVRTGDATHYGNLTAYGNTQLNASRVSTSGTTTTFDLIGSIASAPVIVSGGTSGFATTDCLVDSSGNIYQPTAVTSGVITTISLAKASVIYSAAPANPVTLTVISGSGTGSVTVNLTWTKPTTLSINPTGAAVTLPRATINSGATFGSQTVATVTDLSKHIALYSTTYGLNITANRLNIVAPSAASIFANINGSDVANITSTGLNATAIGATTAATGTFTSLTATGTATFSGSVTGTGLSTYLASPPAIGSTSPNTGAFTQVFANNWLQAGLDASTGYIFCNLNGASGSTRYFQFQTASGNRWAVGCNNTVESSTATGSDFFINAFDNSGNYLSSPLTIVRSSGQLTIPNGAIITGGSLDNAPVGATTASTGAFTTLSASGTATAPTVTPATDSSTKIATTAFVAPSFNNMGRNLFHNAQFIVQQRGPGVFGLNVLTADRWATSGLSDTVSISFPALSDTDRGQIGDETAANTMQNNFTGNAGSTAYNAILQRIENVRRLAGKTVTFSFWARATSGTPKLGIGAGQIFGTGGTPSATVVLNGQSTSALTGTFTRYSFTFSLPSISGKTLGTNGDDFTQFAFWYSSGSTNNTVAGNIGVQTGIVQIWGAQLEIGSVATAFEKTDPADDYARCRRYYQIAYGVARWTATASGQWMESTVNFQPMRITPTAGTISGGSVNNLGSEAVFPVSNNTARYAIQSAAAGDTYGLIRQFTLTADI